jgi:streptomycin 6-kinase
MTSAPGVPVEPPERLSRAAVTRAGEDGRRWLAGLPDLVGEFLERWELTPVRVVRPGGGASLVVLVTTADGGPAVLKAALPVADGGQEHAALAHWDGHCAVRLLRADPDRGVLLLERLHAAITLRSLPDAKATLEAVGVLRRLWVPPAAGHPFTTVADRTERRAAALREAGTLPWAADLAPLIDEALAERDRLTAVPYPAPVLLHGEFRHGAVLAAERAPWLAVGPDPLVGDPAYDLAWLARERLLTLAAGSAAPAVAARRLSKLADALDVDRDRLRGWTVFRAVEAGARALAAGARADGELLLEFAGWL